MKELDLDDAVIMVRGDRATLTVYGDCCCDTPWVLSKREMVEALRMFIEFIENEGE